MIQSILFDWSGVISDDSLPTFHTYNLLFKHYGVREITFKEFQENFELPYGNFCARYIPNIPLEEIAQKFRELFNTLAIPPKLIPDAAEAVKILHAKKINMAVLSSHPYVSKEAALFFPRQTLFNPIYEDVHDKKEAIHHLLQESRFKKETTLFVGDMTYDIEVGQQAGVQTAGVVTGYHSREVLEKFHPNFIFQNLSEILDIL